MKELSYNKIEDICKGLGIPFITDDLPTIDVIRDKLQNVILDDSASSLSNYEYELIEHAFIFGIIYGANYPQNKTENNGKNN